MLETLHDVVEELADQLGVYGSHPPETEDGERRAPCPCRVCWASSMETRIHSAVELEQKLAKLAAIDDAKEERRG